MEARNESRKNRACQKSALARGEQAGKLALLEELKTMPFGAVWDMHCLRSAVPVGPSWIDAMMDYGTKIVSERG